MLSPYSLDVPDLTVLINFITARISFQPRLTVESESIDCLSSSQLSHLFGKRACVCVCHALYAAFSARNEILTTCFVHADAALVRLGYTF